MAVQEAFQYYQTAFNTVFSAYSVLAGEVLAQDRCMEGANKASIDISRACITCIKDAFQRSLNVAASEQITKACSAGVKETLFILAAGRVIFTCRDCW